MRVFTGMVYLILLYYGYVLWRALLIGAVVGILVGFLHSWWLGLIAGIVVTVIGAVLSKELW